MRVSSYTIGSPLPGQPFYLLLHGYTGAMDKVADNLGQVLVENRGREVELNGLPEDVAARLESRGYLTRLDPEEERSLLVSIASELHERDLASHTTAFVLIPTYICNLRCPYCFQSTKMHDGQGRFGQLMSREQVDQIFSIMDRFSNTGAFATAVGRMLQPPSQRTSRPPYLTLFGGEPLLEVTLSVVTWILERAVGRDIGVSAITNGVELDCFRHLLAPGLIDDLQITLDGPSEAHDHRRVGPNYHQTFDRIADNIQMALDQGVKVGVRINVDSANIGQFKTLETFFEARG
jgi:uncharacterized protein